MARNDVPLGAVRIEALACLADDGRVCRLHVYQWRRAGHELPEWHVIQFAEHPGGRIDTATRTVVHFSGKTARYRLRTELAASRRMFAKQPKAEPKPLGVTLRSGR